VKRKAEAERKRIQRVQPKKSFQNAETGEKRLTDDSKIDRCRKRTRNIRSQIRNQPSITKSIIQLDSTAIGNSNDTNNDPIATLDTLQLPNADRWSNSVNITFWSQYQATGVFK